MDQVCLILLVSLYLYFTSILITFSHVTDERTVTNTTNKFKVVTKSQRFKKYKQVEADQSKTGTWVYLEYKKTVSLLECAGDCLDATNCTGFFFLSGAENNCFLNDRFLRSDQRKFHAEMLYFEVANKCTSTPQICNSGVCLPNLMNDSYTCECPSGVTGSLCEHGSPTMTTTTDMTQIDHEIDLKSSLAAEYIVSIQIENGNFWSVTARENYRRNIEASKAYQDTSTKFFASVIGDQEHIHLRAYGGRYLCIVSRDGVNHIEAVTHPPDVNCMFKVYQVGADVVYLKGNNGLYLGQFTRNGRENIEANEATMETQYTKFIMKEM